LDKGAVLRAEGATFIKSARKIKDSPDKTFNKGLSINQLAKKVTRVDGLWHQGDAQS